MVPCNTRVTHSNLHDTVYRIIYFKTQKNPPAPNHTGTGGLTSLRGSKWPVKGLYWGVICPVYGLLK
jgi:hypothetical protein